MLKEQRFELTDAPYNENEDSLVYEKVDKEDGKENHTIIRFDLTNKIFYVNHYGWNSDGNENTYTTLTIDNKLYTAIQKLIEHLGWWGK